MSTGSNRPGTEGGDELMHKDDQHESTFPAFLLTPCGVKGKFLSISTQREFLPLPEQQGTLFAKTVSSSPRNDSLPVRSKGACREGFIYRTSLTSQSLRLWGIEKKTAENKHAPIPRSRFLNLFDKLLIKYGILHIKKQTGQSKKTKLLYVNCRLPLRC